MKETKQERFIRLAEARVDKITKMMRLLGNCSFKSNYEYTDEQVEKIFDKLRAEIDLAYNRFKNTSKGGRFTLSTEDTLDEQEFPSLFLSLPDGTRLRATAVDDESFPAINIWLQSNENDDEQSVAFVEYNSERGDGKKLCIGVCNSESDDPYFYESFNNSK